MLVDAPLINQHFESIEQLEEVVAKRCCVLQEMREEIKKLTNYYFRLFISKDWTKMVKLSPAKSHTCS
jgi:hypothetical protein